MIYTFRCIKCCFQCTVLFLLCFGTSARYETVRVLCASAFLSLVQNGTDITQHIPCIILVPNEAEPNMLKWRIWVVHQQVPNFVIHVLCLYKCHELSAAPISVTVKSMSYTTRPHSKVMLQWWRAMKSHWQQC